MRNQQFPIPWIVKMPIENMDKVRAMLAVWCIVIGHGFHPDTRGANYQGSKVWNMQKGGSLVFKKRTFTERQAQFYDASIRQCFEICDKCGVDLYALALRIYEMIFGLDVKPNTAK